MKTRLLFWEVLGFVVKLLYQKGWRVFNFHLTLVSQGYQPEDIADKYHIQDPESKNSLLKCIAFENSDMHFEFFELNSDSMAQNIYSQFHRKIVDNYNASHIIETDELNGLLAHLKEQYNANKTKITSIENVSSVVKEISMLTVYNPDIIRKFVREIRVYENERIEIDLLSNDDFIINILNQVTKVAV